MHSQVIAFAPICLQNKDISHARFDKQFLFKTRDVFVLANASILTNRILPIVRAERSFVTIFSTEALETIAPKIPATKSMANSIPTYPYHERNNLVKQAIVNELIRYLFKPPHLLISIFHVENFQSYSSNLH